MDRRGKMFPGRAAVMLVCATWICSGLLGADKVKPAAKCDAANKAAPVAAAVDKTKPVAKVTFIKGRAKATTPGQRARRIKQDMAVFIGDVILTGRGTKLEIKFNDGTSISLGARAKMTIDHFLYDPKGKHRDQAACRTSILKGAFKVVSGAISKVAPDRIKVKTPTATIGIRGTACVGTTDERTTIAIYTEGHAISVTNDFGQTILTGKAGMGCETLAGKAPGPAKMYKIEQINRIVNLVAMNAARTATRAATNAANANVHVVPHVPACH